MNRAGLVGEIRVQRSDSELAQSRAAALEVEIRGESSEIERLRARLASAEQNRVKLIDKQRGAHDESRFAGLFAVRLGRLLVDVELGELSEGGITAAVTTAKHAAHRESLELAEVTVAELDELGEDFSEVTE